MRDILTGITNQDIATHSFCEKYLRHSSFLKLNSIKINHLVKTKYPKGSKRHHIYIMKSNELTFIYTLRICEKSSF